MPKAISFAAVAALSLSGCGFTPLYGAPGLATDLSAIQVTVPQGRSGFLLRQSLNDAFAHNGFVPSVYRLNVTYTETKIPRGVRADNVANRYELVLQVSYTLTTAGGASARSGRVTSAVTYDSANQPYASIAAEQDGQERAAAKAARQIQIELASWLASKRPPA